MNASLRSLEKRVNRFGLSIRPGPTCYYLVDRRDPGRVVRQAKTLDKLEYDVRYMEEVDARRRRKMTKLPSGVKRSRREKAKRQKR